MNSELDFPNIIAQTPLFFGWVYAGGWEKRQFNFPISIKISSSTLNFQVGFVLPLPRKRVWCLDSFCAVFFLLLTTEPTLLESWVCLTILLIITNKSFATSFVDFFVANHGYCNLVSLAHGNSQGFWNPPVVVFSVRKTRGLKIVVADDFGIYASAPSWMLDDDEEDDVEKDAHRSSSNIYNIYI